MDEPTQASLQSFWLACGLDGAAWPPARDAFIRYHDLIAAANATAGLMGANWEQDFYFKHVADSLALLLPGVLPIANCRLPIEDRRPASGSRQPEGPSVGVSVSSSEPRACETVPTPKHDEANRKSTIDNRQFRLADVGCGAGLPGLVLAIALPNLRLTAIESHHKKADFVAEAARELGLAGRVTVAPRRARELSHDDHFAGRFDLVTARAVASADKLIRECRLLLAPGGCAIFYKTPAAVEAELPLAQREAAKHGLTIDASPVITLPARAGARQFLRIRSPLP